jgi:glycosyltransferase involved in cell wall biosynthesis
MAMTKRLKILISAYACSPMRGSEPGVGWGFISALAHHHDLWVIVEEKKFRAEIEQYLVEHSSLSASIHFFFIPKKRNRILRKIWPPSYYKYYRVWHEEALKLAVKLHRDVQFDLAHQLTMVGFREPGYLWKLGIPFVWGPVGGMGLFPWRFLAKAGIYGAVYYICYNLVNLWQMRFSSRPKLASRAARGGLICATSENRDCAIKHWHSQSTIMCEVGLPHMPNREVRKRSEIEPFRIIWSGIHAHRKALNLGLEALAFLPSHVCWELHILGEGQRTVAWQRVAERLGIADHCCFHGWQPRAKALEIMKQAHAMLITSLRDLTSTVTVEALALGLPIVCLNHCGFSDAVTAKCGIRIPISSPSRVVAGLAEALERLAIDEAFRQSLAEAALERAKDFAWDKKLELLETIYNARLIESSIPLVERDAGVVQSSLSVSDSGR